MAQQGPSITGPALSALAKDTGNKGAGSNAGQRDLSSHCTSGALSPEQDPGLAYSGTHSRGLFLGVPVEVALLASPLRVAAGPLLPPGPEPALAQPGLLAATAQAPLGGRASVTAAALAP